MLSYVILDQAGRLLGRAHTPAGAARVGLFKKVGRRRK